MGKIRGSPCPSVDGGNPAIQLRLGSLSHYLQGFSTIPGGWPWDFFHQQLGVPGITLGITGIHHCEVASIYALAKVPVVNDRVSTAGSCARNKKWRKPQIEMQVSKKLFGLGNAKKEDNPPNRNAWKCKFQKCVILLPDSSYVLRMPLYVRYQWPSRERIMVTSLHT